MTNRVIRCARVIRELTGKIRDLHWEYLKIDLELLDNNLALLLVHPRITWPVRFRVSESPATGATLEYAEQLIKGVALKARERLRLAEKPTARVPCGWAKRDVEQLRVAIAAFLKARPPGAPPPPPPGSGRSSDPRSSDYWRDRFRGVRANGHPPHAALIEEVITTGFRDLAKKYHPDKGGSTEAMQQLNQAVAWLRKQHL